MRYRLCPLGHARQGQCKCAIQAAVSRVNAEALSKCFRSASGAVFVEIRFRQAFENLRGDACGVALYMCLEDIDCPVGVSCGSGQGSNS